MCGGGCGCCCESFPRECRNSLNQPILLFSAAAPVAPIATVAAADGNKNGWNCRSTGTAAGTQGALWIQDVWIGLSWSVHSSASPGARIGGRRWGKVQGQTDSPKRGTRYYDMISPIEPSERAPW
jgi:hypothetical protein